MKKPVKNIGKQKVENNCQLTNNATEFKNYKNIEL